MDGTFSPLDPTWAPAPAEPVEQAAPAFTTIDWQSPAPADPESYFSAPAAAQPQAYEVPAPAAPIEPPPFEPPPLEPAAFEVPVLAAPVASIDPPLVLPVEDSALAALLDPVPGRLEAGVDVAASPEAPQAPDAVFVRGAMEDGTAGEINLNDLLVQVLERKASDLHLTVGARPALRLNGHLQQLEEYPVLTPPVIQKAMYAIITQRQREKFEEVLELDFAYAVPGKARFRVNLYKQRDSVGAAFRLIPYEIKRLEDLGVPPSVANFSHLPRGFVLVTGPTGSGKSTTLASLIDLVNRNRRDHIMTVEDPIEFLHPHHQCLVNQREVGEDTWSFQNALKHVLRQDPDVILVGELRDLETISVALTAAETGHLVFATLHTQDAAQTIDRIIDVFPPHQQQQVRVQLAGALQGVVAQQLCRTYDGKGRVVCTEVLVATPAIRNLIREGKTHQIYSALQSGGKYGMQTMDQHLGELVKQGRITYETGLEKCHHVEDFNRLCGRA